MSKKQILAVCGASIAVIAVPAVADATKLSVRVEGKTKTLLAPKSVKVGAGSITRFGAPAGACPAASAQGALDVATHHKWVGTWSTQFGPEYFINSILGENYGSSKSYFWEIFVNNVAASAGACQIKAHRGQRLLFAAVPATGTEYPTALIIPSHARVGHTITGKVVWYNAKGVAKPLAGATVTVAGKSGKTNSAGTVPLTPSHAGSFTLTAAKAGYIRAAAVRLTVAP